MKKLIFSLYKATTATCLLVCLLMGFTINAQTLVTPSGVSPGNPVSIGTGSGNFTSIETAMINYYSGLTQNGIMAFVDVNTYTGYDVNFLDLAISSSYVTCTLSHVPSGNVDVALLNDPVRGAHHYYAAVFYTYSSSVILDLIPIYDDGASTFTLGAITSISNSTAAATVHLDAIADYSTVSGGSLPLVTSLMLTWDDPSSSGNVFASYIDLNSIPGSISATTIGSGQNPDIAAVERTVLSINHHIGLIAYTSASGDHIYYREWDHNASTVSAATTLDGGSSGDFSGPRIDAIDDNGANAPGGLNAIYKVVAQHNASGAGDEIRTYDNLLGASSHWTCSGVENLFGLGSYGFVAPPYGHYSPSVALGGPISGASQQYLVMDYMNYDPGMDVIFMLPIDITSSSALALVSGVHKYYWANEGPSTPQSADGYYLTSTSSAVNSPYMNSIVAWVTDDGFGSYRFEYHLTPYPYGFKPANTKQAEGIGWQLYPNPTMEQITITCPAAAGVTAGYEIMDIMGRSMASGTLQGGSQKVDLSALKPGQYVLKLNREDGAGSQKMFVKE